MIKVLLVDDNAILRKEVKYLLPDNESIFVVGECSDGKDILGVLKNANVDVILMDINMKYVGGIEATKFVKQKYPEVKVVAFSSHSEEYYVNAMVLAGASDYIVKGTDIKTIRSVINSVVLEDLVKS